MFNSRFIQIPKIEQVRRGVSDRHRKNLPFIIKRWIDVLTVTRSGFTDDQDTLSGDLKKKKKKSSLILTELSSQHFSAYFTAMNLSSSRYSVQCTYGEI